MFSRNFPISLKARYHLARTGMLDEATKTLLDRAAAAVASGPHVEGRILLDHGLPAAKLFVRLYNRGFGGAAVKLGQENAEHG
jgi:hypothetical protein